MSMLEDPNNFVFVVALGLLLGLMVIEVISLVLGWGASSALEHILPDGFDAPDLSVDAPSGLDKFLSWLYVGRAPLLVVLIGLLFTFAAGGLILQSLAINAIGMSLTPWLAVPVVFVASLFVAHWVIAPMARWLPSDESQAVCWSDLAGRLAQVTQGTATTELPATARVQDEHGQSHAVLVVPENASGVLEQGQHVLLLEHRSTNLFVASPVDDTELSFYL